MQIKPLSVRKPWPDVLRSAFPLARHCEAIRFSKPPLQGEVPSSARRRGEYGSAAWSQVVGCIVNFSLIGQTEQRTNRKAIPQTNCAPRSVAAAASATNVPPAHLLNAAAKETPFRGEDSVFFPPKDPLIETAKEGPSGPSFNTLKVTF